ncbi:MAG: hypothetical protein AABX02_02990, partial [archaeon]
LTSYGTILVLRKEFGMKVLEELNKTGSETEKYEFASEHVPSDVILVAKTKYHKKTWIDFDRFFELINVPNAPENLDAMEYSKAREEVKESVHDFGVTQ